MGGGELNKAIKEVGDVVIESELREFVPNYFGLETRAKFGIFGRMLFGFLKIFLKFSINLILDPRKGQVGNLDPDEVERVYEREAKKYNAKHHLTTRGQDLKWRRQAGFVVMNYILQNRESNIHVLDICTGTGLTIKEMCRVLDVWGMDIGHTTITGLDYSADMLREAEKNTFGKRHNVNFVRGDATRLIDGGEHFKSIEANSIDVVTQMFGIGGIDKPRSVLSEVLKVLKPGGQYFLIDMHKPIEELPGEWFCFGKWLKMPVLELKVYKEITIPLVLMRKWAWRDTTQSFYDVRLINYFDKKCGQHYGFKVLNFEYNADRWWLTLPIMPIAGIIVEKVEISEAEAKRRSSFLNKI